MPVADFGPHSQRFAKPVPRPIAIQGNPVHMLGAQRGREQILAASHHHLASVAANFHDVEWTTRRDPQSFALADGEIVNPGMMAKHLACNRHQLP